MPPLTNDRRGIERREYDVIVVGARAAGSATAMLLARAGHRVLVLDRASRGADTLSTHALLRGGVVQLTRWGLLARVLDSGTPELMQSTFRFPDAGFVLAVEPALLAPKRTVLDPLLADAALAAGADICFGTVVDELVLDGGGRAVGVIAHDLAGRSFRADAPITIGADGARSFVARSVAADTYRVGHHATGVAYAYFDQMTTGGYEWCWSPGRAAGVIPTNDGQALVFTSVRAREFRTLLAGDLETGFHRVLDEVWPDVAGRVVASRRVGRFRGFPGMVGRVRQSFGPGWALVGDAGYWKDPISAHGLTDALRDAELLASAVNEVLDGAEDVEALAAYQSTRDALSHTLFDVVDRMASLDWSIEEIQALLVQFGAAMEPEIEYLERKPLGVA
jgi:2-polyprenyl-6-methoxyphenol hydroxylase-like FAD-dependent oxidoreductase